MDGPGLEKNSGFPTKTVTPLSIQYVVCSIEPSCNSRHNISTGVVWFLEESSHVFLILDNLFKCTTHIKVYSLWFLYLNHVFMSTNTSALHYKGKVGPSIHKGSPRMRERSTCLDNWGRAPIWADFNPKLSYCSSRGCLISKVLNQGYV